VQREGTVKIVRWLRSSRESMIAQNRANERCKEEKQHDANLSGIRHRFSITGCFEEHRDRKKKIGRLSHDDVTGVRSEEEGNVVPEKGRCALLRSGWGCSECSYRLK
jgi:hypothetical protein